MLGTPPPVEPLGPVHSTQRHGYRKPADFSMPDHNRPGHTTRNGNYEEYKYLYGALDDQLHAPFEGP